MVWPKYTNTEIALVKNILKVGKVNYWTGGYGKKLEKAFAKFANKKYALCVSNATMALEYSLVALNLNKNDEIIVTPRSYYSSASCILKTKATPVFCDVDLTSQNIDPNDLIKKISKRTKAVIVVHLGGNPSDLEKIKKITKRNKLILIEDCSQAHGARINNKVVGSFGDISIWSFCNDKIISSGGEGGIISLDKKTLFKSLWSYRDIGKDYDKFHRGINSNYYFKWLHDSVGSNFRMTEIQSALAYNQLKNIKKTIERRKLIANEYINKIEKFKWLRIFKDNKKYSSSRYRLNISIIQNFVKEKFNAKKLIKEINKYDFICNEGPCPLIFLEKYFIRKKYKAKKLENSYVLLNNNISFIIDPTISINTYKKRAKHVLSVFNNYNQNVDL